MVAPVTAPITVHIDPASSAEYRLGVLSELARQASHNGTVRAVTDDVVAGARTDGEAVARCLRLCQALPLVLNPPGQEQFQDAVTTLAKGGNCTAKCVLLAGMLLVLRAERGIPLALRIIWERHPETPTDHTVLRVWLRDEPGVTLDPLRENARSNGGASQVVGEAL